MARKFRITIGGVTYNVEVEEIGAAAPAYTPAPAAARVVAPVTRPAAPTVQAVTPAPAPTPSPAPAPTPAPVAGGEGVKAPLPGTITAVKVEVGQTVTAGQVVAILEAMKMENDVTASEGGVVKEIRVAKGAAVAAGDVLIVIG